MTKLNIPLILWEGFTVSHIDHQDDQLIITLKADGLARCRCGKHFTSVHDTTYRLISDRNLLGYRVKLKVPLRRINCKFCGIRTEQISWLEPFSRQTKRLIAYVEKLVELMPIKHISNLVSLHWHTIKNIHKRLLGREVQEPDWSKVRVLMMDEFALFKGHRYATVVADAETNQILWIGEGRSRKAIRPFFEKMGDHCSHIEAVAMDMNTAFDLEVQQHCPNAQVVYDLFHVIAKYGREVIDRVRVDQANQLKNDKVKRRKVKRGRWILLKNRDNLTTTQAGYLEELLEANKDLMTVYLLREQLKEMWYCKTENHASAQWELWWRQVQESSIQPLLLFGKRLKKYVHGITASATHPLHTCKLEGMNNKIKLMKRMGYGYRDTDYFFLKIRAAFPGNMR